MNNFKYVIIILLICVLYIKCINSRSEEINNNEEHECIIIHDVPYFYYDSIPTKQSVYDALLYYDVKYPDIVLAQSILETGHYKSDICINYNNIFGLYNSKLNDFYKFNHWTESIEAYIIYIQYKYKYNEEHPPEEYYKFLQNLGYAEDTNYINKLKRLNKILW